MNRFSKAYESEVFDPLLHMRHEVASRGDYRRADALTLNRMALMDDIYINDYIFSSQGG